MGADVLITGGGGQLAQACENAFGTHALSKEELDITDDEAVRDAIDKLQPAVVINCAAYNNVENTEKDPEQAFKAHALGVMHLARAAHTNGAILVTVSTDYVFDGCQDFFNEDDVPKPCNVYGVSKVAGELLTRAYAEKHYIVRTSALFGEKKGGDCNFVSKRIEDMQVGKTLRIVDDQVTVPTYTKDLARVIKGMIEKKIPFGTYHGINSGGGVTWFEFTKEIAKALRVEASISSISTEESGSVVTRPRNSILVDTKLVTHGIEMPHWKDALSRYTGGGDV